MLIAIIALNVLVTLATQPMGSCETTIKGMVAKKTSEFEEALNRLRNEVAQGRRANHKGQKEYAANMHVITWASGIARAAQNCAERCPDSLYTCRNLQGAYGALSKFKTVYSVSADYSAKDALDKWMEKPQDATQLVWAVAFKFGCGRALKKDIGKLMEYIVCFFDAAPKPGFDAYIAASEKTIASACRLGRSSTYSGLCISPFSSFIMRANENLREQIKMIESKDDEQLSEEQQQQQQQQQ